MPEEILLIRITPPENSHNKEIWYAHVPDRTHVEQQILNLYRSYSEGYKIEVLECNVNHCTKADVVVYW